MREVVIVGGGLTGLSAAYELEKQQMPYTLIEVKRRLGGGIQTVNQAGFVLDGAAFVMDAGIQADSLIHELKLHNELCSIEDDIAGTGLETGPYRRSNNIVFKSGTETLIRALAAKITAPRLMRMAVSSVGELEQGRYALCLENGLLLDAGAIILAVPARYAERMFYGYINEIAQRLTGFAYEKIVHVAMGFFEKPLSPADSPPCSAGRGRGWGDSPCSAGKPLTTADRGRGWGEMRPDIVFVHTTTQPGRVPPGGLLLQAGIRAEPEQIDALLPDILKALNLPAPVTRFVHHWPEVAPIFAETHAENIAVIRALLPPGIALVGSDYGLPPGQHSVANLAERIAQGRHAARQMVAFLRERKR